MFHGAHPSFPRKSSRFSDSALANRKGAQLHGAVCNRFPRGWLALPCRPFQHSAVPQLQVSELSHQLTVLGWGQKACSQGCVFSSESSWSDMLINLLQRYYSLQLYIISLGPQLPPLKIKTPVRFNRVSVRESSAKRGKFLVYTSPRIALDSGTPYPSTKDKLMLTVHPLLL